MPETLLSVRALRVRFPGRTKRRTIRSAVEALRGVDLDIAPHEGVALVGPSGCGKSLTARAICGLLPAQAECSGTIEWEGRNLGDPRHGDWGGARGRGMTLVLQEPKTSLNPVLRIGDQIAETVRLHRAVSADEAWSEANRLLDEVQVPDAAARVRAWPHELSGGMKQRVLLAAALACDPRLLICDEPTTALDPTVQKEVLLLLDRVRRARGMALLFITHDRHLVPLMAERTVHLRDGRVVPETEVIPPCGETFRRNPVARDDRAPVVLRGRELVCRFPTPGSRGGELTAVGGVDLELTAGTAVGLAGESGCGKTTLARLLSGHLLPSAGGVQLEGRPLSDAHTRPAPADRRRVQMIFQDPGQSLNPRQRVGAALTEAGDRATDPARLLEEVDLSSALLDRYPHELSGGQKQRVALARCLACEPCVLVADEITSALDAWTRARVLGLLARIRDERGLALLLVDHDLDTLDSFCDRVMVMAGGRVMEIYSPGAEPGSCHPYTRDLLAVSPRRLGRDPQAWRTVETRRTDEIRTTSRGCPWAPYCPLAKPRCYNELPNLEDRADGAYHRCPEAGN